MEDIHESTNQDLIIKLDQEHRQDISSIRMTMENFLRGQLDLEHKMQLVSENQKSLKERFEEGVSKRLTSLDQKFDKFIMEWGKKQAEDTYRDERIKDAKSIATKAYELSLLFMKTLGVSVVGSMLVVAIIWAIKSLLMH